MQYHFSAKRSLWNTRYKFVLVILGFVLVLSTYIYQQSNRYVEWHAIRKISAEKGQTIELVIAAKNKSGIEYNEGSGFFLSGRIFSTKNILVTELPRFAIALPVHGNISQSITFTVPDHPGSYRVDIDLVKEGQYWMQAQGNRPHHILLTVNGGN